MTRISGTAWVASVLVAGVLVAIAAAEALDGRASSAYISGDEIQSTIGRPPADHFDRPLRVIEASDAHIGVAVIRRPKDWNDCQWVQLDRVTEIIRVISGSGSFVTGGRLKEPKPVTSEDSDSRLMGTGFVGSGIDGGDSRQIAAGDIIIIPAGVPHGFRSINSDAVQLEVVRIDGGRTLALR